jgi:hypothetical protein
MKFPKAAKNTGSSQRNEKATCSTPAEINK